VLQEDTISINHNWLNAANVDICWDFVKDSLVSVEQEIAEHRATLDNWVEHCQVWQYHSTTIATYLFLFSRSVFWHYFRLGQVPSVNFFGTIYWQWSMNIYYTLIHFIMAISNLFAGNK